MAKKEYDWEAGAEYDAHTERKHKILREYLREYLITRCQIPQMERFRFAVVDAFAGAGLYKNGEPGSPLIILDTIRSTLAEINVRRAAGNMRTIEFDCFLVLNDTDRIAFKLLRENTAGLIGQIRENPQGLHLRIDFDSRSFESLYPELKAELIRTRYQNVIFNLDQYAYSDVNLATLDDIMTTWSPAEVFFTFGIQTILAYLSADPSKNRTLSREDELRQEVFATLRDGEQAISKREWLGVAERTIFRRLKAIAPYVSPFSIHNPDGWRYWLIHFANRARARQVYNDTLHFNSTSQAHFGRAGLDMLSYNPDEEGSLYLFDDGSRSRAVDQLHEDIPRMISHHGDVLTIEEFNLGVYKETAAHSADIQKVLIENPELEVLTERGGERRRPNTISGSDTVRLKTQRGFYPMFGTPSSKKIE